MKIIAVVFLAFFLGACSEIEVRDHAERGPAFDFAGFFSGPLVADGFFQDRSGKVVKQIHCEMNARKEGDEWRIDETFKYSDGTTENRTWRIKQTGPKTYEGTAGDVVGPAQIETAGFAFRMKYRLRLKVDGKDLEVSMDDWMYRVNATTVLNKTKMSKWGIHLGDVSLAIQKL